MEKLELLFWNHGVPLIIMAFFIWLLYVVAHMIYHTGFKDGVDCAKNADKIVSGKSEIEYSFIRIDADGTFSKSMTGVVWTYGSDAKEFYHGNTSRYKTQEVRGYCTIYELMVKTGAK